MQVAFIICVQVKSAYLAFIFSIDATRLTENVSIGFFTSVLVEVLMFYS